MQTSKPSRYITNTKVNSVFSPSKVSIRVPDCLAEIMEGCIYPCQVTLCDHRPMAGDVPYFSDKFSMKSYTI